MNAALLVLALLSVELPAPGEVETLVAGETATLQVSGGEAWFRILEDDYVLLEVTAGGGTGMMAYSDYGAPLVGAEDGSLLLSAFSHYWFWVRLTGDDGPVDVGVDEAAPGEVRSASARAGGTVSRDEMGEAWRWSPGREGLWRVDLQSLSETDLDLEVYGPGMTHWGSSMDWGGEESVSLALLPSDTLTVHVIRYGKGGDGGYRLSTTREGDFPRLGSGRAMAGTAVPGEVRRWMVRSPEGRHLLYLTFDDPMADLDLVVRDTDGEELFGSRTYETLEALLLPGGTDCVVEVLPFDLPDYEPMPFDLGLFPLSEPEDLPVNRTLGVDRVRPEAVGFTADETGVYEVSAAFEKTRDGDVLVFRGDGEPAFQMASSRGVESFLLYMEGGRTAWILPWFGDPEVSGDVDLSVMRSDAPRLSDGVSGSITPASPAYMAVAELEAGDIGVLELSGDDREVDLDMLVSGPSGDLQAQGWLSSVDAAGDESVALHVREGSETGVTVYLWDRRGETGFRLTRRTLGNPPLAAPSPEREVWALSVGISGYPSTADVLNRASMDAVEVYDFLTGEQGVPADHAVLLVDDMATMEAFRESLSDLLAAAGSEDVLLVFFSGHGFRLNPGTGGEEEGDSANETLCLYDGDIEDDELAGTVADLAEARVVLVLDACHSGGFVGDFEGLENTMVLTAAREDLSVSERILTPMVLEGSRGAADADGDGYVSAMELLGYIDDRLQLVCPECDAALLPGQEVCGECGAKLVGENAVPRPEQGMFLEGDVRLWRCR